MYRQFTTEDYFRHEHLPPTDSPGLRSEYYRGEILTVPGASLQHGLIVNNVAAALRRCRNSNGKSCLVVTQDVKFYVPDCDLIAYPDIMMLCEPPAYMTGKEGYVLLNPTVIGEVLSPSTARYDRDQKVPCYLSVSSVKAVLLIKQHERRVELYTKERNEPQLFTSGAFRLNGCLLTVEPFYENIPED